MTNTADNPPRDPRLGLEGQFFSTPRSIMASFGPQDDQHTFMIRVEPAQSGLGRLAGVDQIAAGIAAFAGARVGSNALGPELGACI